jgi:hypothetical protein
MHQQVLESFNVLLESFQKLHRPVLCTIVLFGKFQYGSYSLSQSSKSGFSGKESMCGPLRV